MSAQLKTIDPELAAAISVAGVTLASAEAAFKAARETGSKAAYIHASNELTLARIHLEDLQRQAGL